MEIFTFKMGITGGSQDLENTILNGKEGNIESTTTKVIHNDLRFITLLETVGNSGSGRFIDNTQNLETGDCSSVLSSLSLALIEI